MAHLIDIGTLYVQRAIFQTKYKNDEQQFVLKQKMRFEKSHCIFEQVQTDKRCFTAFSVAVVIVVV